MRYKSLTLILTYDCNLACDYCFCGRKRKENMSEEMAKQAIDYFCENSEGKCNLVFFGGEPLLRADLIEELCRYCNEKYPDKFSYCITTNGTLINPRTVKLLEDNNIGVTLSMDGMRESHDLHRRFCDGRPSFDVIMKNIHENNFKIERITTRLTFTRYNVHKLAENLIGLHKEGFRNLAFYPASDKNDMYTEEDINNFRKEIDKLMAYTYNCYQTNNPINISWFNKSIRSHINGSCERCMAGVRQFSVTPDGDFYPCNRVDFNDKTWCIGNLQNGIDKKKQLELQKELLKEDPECDGCSLKSRCSICQIDAYNNTGTVWKKPEFYCLMNQYVIFKADELATRLFNEKNEIFIRQFYKEIPKAV